MFWRVLLRLVSRRAAVSVVLHRQTQSPITGKQTESVENQVPAGFLWRFGINLISSIKIFYQAYLKDSIDHIMCNFMEIFY